MAMILPQVPPASMAALREALPAVMGSASLMTHLPRLRQGLSEAMSPRREEPPLSILVYVVGLDEILRRNDLLDVKPVFWIHVVSQRSKLETPVVIAQTDLATSQFLALAEGPADFWREFDKLKTLQEVDHADFDLAELRVPALHIEAFLLRPKSGGSDIVVPFRSHDLSVKVGQSYKLSDFLIRLRPSAKSVLGMESEEPTGG